MIGLLVKNYYFGKKNNPNCHGNTEALVKKSPSHRGDTVLLTKKQS